jgi:N-acetylglucosaminyl-diphospho-decaprenol L-rhamnosyltransferase
MPLSSHTHHYPFAVADVTVSIVAGGDAGLLRGCLESIPAAAVDTGVRVVVVDNAVPGGIDVREGVEVVRNAERRGFGANHNAALADVASRYAFILNDDTVLDPGCIDRLRAFMDQNAAVAAAGPRLRYPDGRVQASAFHFPTPLRVAATAATLQRAGWDMSAGERIRRVDWIHGAAMMVRTDAFRATGGLDERFFMYLEDVDLCRRLRDAGWEVAFFPRAGLVHLENAASARTPERRIVQHARSRGLYTRKHHGVVAAGVVQAATAAMFAARAGLALVLPGYDADDARRFRTHVRASLHPGAGQGIEDG